MHLFQWCERRIKSSSNSMCHTSASLLVDRKQTEPYAMLGMCNCDKSWRTSAVVIGNKEAPP